jgi:succinoglycan biosynthesis transport protein ExoP
MEQNQSLQEARLHVLDYWRVIRTRKAVVIAVFLLVVLVASTVTFLQPRLYSAAARIKVEQEHPNVAVFTQNTVSPYDPYFLQTQYEIIQSQKILNPTIERLNLMKIWADRHQPVSPPSMDIASSRLKRQVSVRPSRNTTLIEIAVVDEEPQLAALIANTIASVFEKERLQVKQDQVRKGLDKLHEEQVEQRMRVEAAQAKIEKLRKDLNVPILGRDTKLTEITISGLEGQLTAARIDLVTHETRLNGLKKLNPQQMRNAIATIITDPTVQSLLAQLTESNTNLERLKEDFGPDHPTVRAAIAVRDKQQEQMDARLEGVIRGFEIEFLMAQAKVTEIQRQLDEAKSNNISIESEKYLPFRVAQREEEEETRTYQQLKARIDQEEIEIRIPRSPVEVIDEAQPPRAPFSPKIALNITLGGIVGLVLGIALTFFLEFLDTSIKKMEDVERYLGLSVLGVVAREGELITRGTASPQLVESYRMLRTNIEFARGENTPKSLAVLSAGAGEGKSFTITNLASVYAQHGARVLIVDSDLRRPNIHKNLNLPNTTGLTDYLSGNKTVDEIILPTSIPNLFAIVAGGSGQTKSALPLLTSHRMQELITQAGQQFDIVLYDTPPVLAVSDATVVANEVGSSMLVVQHRRYPRAMSIRAKHAIENAGGRLIGVIVNNVNVGQDESYYYYHDHYDRYLQPQDKSIQRPAPPAVGEPPKPATDEIEWQGKY